MGEVYLAEHVRLRRPVALKILPPKMGSEDHVNRFLKEARTCSQIEHPNVVVIHDVGEQDGLYYIVMQYVQGKNLSQLLSERGSPLPWRSGVRLIQLAAGGLHAVHCRGLVHRDVKPSNVMLSVDSRVLLMDFGLVREELDSSLTSTGQVLGTPAFMSPEQCRGNSLDRRSDIYSLGSTLYCLLAGHPPFKGSFQKTMAEISSGKAPKPIHLCNEEVPQEVSALLNTAMAPRPEERFDTAEAMSRQLKRVLRASPLKDISTWQTAELSAVNMETQAVEELPPVELLPLETKWELIQRKLPVIGGMVGICSCLMVLALAVYFMSSGNSREPSPVLPAMKATAKSGESGQVANPDADKVSAILPNMIHIEGGNVQTGNTEARLRAHWQAMLGSNETLMKQALAIADAETPDPVFVKEFWIDQYEVTNREYARFIKSTQREAPAGWNGNNPPAGKEDHPVDNIRHQDAEAYAKWAGKKLPTREQWVRAFRGDRDWLFPWGNQFEAERTNVAENSSFPRTSPITATPRDKSPFGVYNMVGNVSEFLRDKITINGQTMAIAKGSHFAWRGNLRGLGCVRFLVGSQFVSPGMGFRCVVETEHPNKSLR